MRLGIAGLGRMGANMARRLMSAGHQVAGFNRTAEVTEEMAKESELIPSYSFEELVEKLEHPRIVWTMVPAGKVTEEYLNQLAGLMSEGDILIDGANSNFNDTIRRAGSLQERGIHFLDAGVSGGIWGLDLGYSLMIGGERQVVDQLRPIFSALAPGKDQGWGWVGPHGAGHFTKMVHNGIEYGMMEALAEGFDLLRARQDFSLDLHQISEIWQHGSVVRSWLLELVTLALKDDPELTEIQAWVEDSGEGRWTVVEAINQSVPAPVIALALFRRFESRDQNSYAFKMLAALRKQFGGHEVRLVE